MSTDKSSPPPWRFLFRHPSHFIACGMGSGLSPVAPGTAGTLFAWLTYPLLQACFGGSDVSIAIFLSAAFVYGVFACDRTGRALGVADHGAIVCIVKGVRLDLQFQPDRRYMNLFADDTRNAAP